MRLTLSKQAQASRINGPRLLSVAILLIVLLLASSAATPHALAQSPTVVKFDPSDSVVAVGKTVVVNIRIENVTNLSGAEIHLTYDPFLLEAQIESGGFPTPDQVLQSSVANGSIDFAITQIASQHSPVSGSGILLKITFKGLAEGESKLHMLSAVLSDKDARVISSMTQDGSVTVGIPPAGNITGVVLRQGVPPSSGPGTLACTQVNTLSSANTVATLTDSNGKFLLSIPGGTYTARTSYPGYLQSQKFSVSVSGGQVLIGTTRLCGGDVNGDNKINILDFVGIIVHFGGPAMVGSGPSCPIDNPFDINDDGFVDIRDLAIASGNAGMTGPTSWLPYCPAPILIP
jgi:hypothetical protein